MVQKCIAFSLLNLNIWRKKWREKAAGETEHEYQITVYNPHMDRDHTHKTGKIEM